MALIFYSPLSKKPIKSPEKASSIDHMDQSIPYQIGMCWNKQKKKKQKKIDLIGKWEFVVSFEVLHITFICLEKFQEWQRY